MSRSPSGARRLVLFAVVVLLAGALGGGYLVKTSADLARERRPTASTAADRGAPLRDVLGQPHIAFRSTAPGPTYGKLAVVPLRRPGGPRAATDLDCDRVYAASTGAVCVAADRGVVTTYELVALDAGLRRKSSLDLNGIPSRVRLSGDGSMAATTMFVTGHSYAGSDFSTETVIHDVDRDVDLGNVEDWRILVGGRVATAADVNVWGVTFAPGSPVDRFYATVATGGRNWLAQGSIERRELRAIHADVECPSVSPSGRLIAFKKHTEVAGRGGWLLTVLDLRTGEETTLAETRSVDDQPEWLDEGHVVYGLQREGTAVSDVWVVPVAGGRPSVLVPRAWSPSVVREAGTAL